MIYSKKNINPFKLCLVTHRQYHSFDVYQDMILQSIQGGVTSVQLRDKYAQPDQLYDMAVALKTLLSAYHIPLIINDHIEIAKAIRADGVHLGQSDVSPEFARAQLGPDVYIGLSIESYDELLVANQLTCIDYVAASAVFQSTTKTDCATIWGLDGLRRICVQSSHPVIAIGGISLDNIDAVMSSGAAGVAVVSAIHQASCPKLAAAELIARLGESV